MKVEDPCPLCGSADLSPVYRPRGTARDLTVHVCSGCGLVQSLPRRASVGKRPTSVSGGADWGNVRYGKGFRLADTMDAIGTSRPARVLDIGSNRGAFVQAAHERWPDAAITAVEPDARVVDTYRGLPGVTLHVGPIEDVALPPAGFDLIHCSHTLEHLADPIAVLGQIAVALTPGGVAYLEVPDLATIGRDDLVEEWFIDKHLYHFDAASLSSALASAGLVPVAGIRSALHLCAVVRRGTWAGIVPTADPKQVAGLIDGYDRRLAGNQQRLHAAADQIAELARQKRVVVWGAGRILDSLIRIGGLEPMCLAGVVDRHLVKHAPELHGISLLAPAALPELRPETVIIASREFAAEIAAEAVALVPDVITVPYAELLAQN